MNRRPSTPYESTVRHVRDLRTETGTLRRVKTAFGRQLKSEQATAAESREPANDARWTLKIGGEVRYRPDGTRLPMIAVPVFGCKRRISVGSLPDRRWLGTGLLGFIRYGAVNAASAPAERAMRSLAPGRKNLLFAGSEAGGRAVAGDKCTLIGSETLNGVGPPAWLAKGFARMPDATITACEDLTPWNHQSAASSAQRP